MFTQVQHVLQSVYPVVVIMICWAQFLFVCLIDISLPRQSKLLAFTCFTLHGDQVNLLNQNEMSALLKREGMSLEKSINQEAFI